MLTQYETRTRQLLQNPGAPTTLYATSDIDGWINQARGQLSGEAECIRVLGTIPTVLNQRFYNFSSINTGVQATTGVAGMIHVRSIRYAVASGYQAVYSRAYPWFDQFYLNNPVPGSGPPVDWAQYAQGGSGQMTGSGASGSFCIDPLPDLIYQLTCDCVCYPQALVDDTTVEAIPYLWTDAVPYYAAYLALLSSQTQARRADAEAYFSYYQTFVARARQFANPALSRNQWEQGQDLTLPNKMALGGKPQ